MTDYFSYQFLADAVLVLHTVVVVFVIGGFCLIIVGNLCTWRWVNNLWFRLAHFLAVAVVMLQAWLGTLCPLTVIEMWLRDKAHAATYSGSFIEYWLQRLLYFNAPSWVFTLVYTLFGLLVLFVWWYFPPQYRRRR